MAKVLLVEDDNNLREIFEMRLQAEGYETLIASDGEEALVVALKEKPDLIIADVMMPKMSGFEMMETLRAAPDMKDVKVVMMTALGQAEDQARGEKLGVVKYLVKSQVTLEDFVRVVKEVVPPGESSGTTKNETTPTDSRGPDQSVEADDKATNNKESEQNMPPTDPNAPTNPPAGDTPSGDTNPISGPTPADDGQMSTAQAQDSVKSQVNDFASAPTSDPAAASSDVSGPAPAPDVPAPAPGPDAPTPTPPSDTPPTDGPATPTPPGGM